MHRKSVQSKSLRAQPIARLLSCIAIFAAASVMAGVPTASIVAGNIGGKTVISRDGSDGAAQGTSSLPLTNPALNLQAVADVRGVVRMPDGNLIVFGDFNEIGGESRAGIAKLHPNGSVDATWDPAPYASQGNATISCVAVDNDGNVYVGGDFEQIGGLDRVNLAKLAGNGTGTADGNWAPDPDGEVDTCAFDGAGMLYVGGGFHDIGGAARDSIARIPVTGNGAADATWNPSANSDVYTLVLDGQGNVFVGGAFWQIGGQTRYQLAKLSTSGTGGADPTWDPASDGGGTITRLALDNSGNLYAAGNFSVYDEHAHGYIVKVTVGGTVDNAWAPMANAVVHDIRPDDSGSVYVAGEFTSIDEVSGPFLAKLSASGTGSADTSWVPAPDSIVYGLTDDGTGNLVVAGQFSEMGGEVHRGVAFVNESSAVVTGGADAYRPGIARTISRQPDGSLIVGGQFVRAQGSDHFNVLRLARNGVPDSSWVPVVDGDVFATASAADGDVYIGGNFSHVDGEAHRGLARLTADNGSPVGGWNVSVDDVAVALATDSGGNLLVGGQFQSVNASFRPYLVRISPGGVVDTSWAPAPDGIVRAIVVDDADNVYIGGYFSHVGSVARAGLARIADSGSGAVDPMWQADTDNRSIFCETLDGKGHLFVGGYFTQVNGTARHHVAKLSTLDGSVDPDWNPALDDGGQVYALAVDAEGYVFAGGTLHTVDTQFRPGVARMAGSGTGELDANWSAWVTKGPGYPGSGAPAVFALQVDDGDNRLYVGGDFTRVGDDAATGFAVLADDPDDIFRNGFD